jgi:hypothetical protein
MDELDDHLKNRIKEVFDNFEDASADEGWLLLREKFPEDSSKRRAIAWMWWGGAAAILLVFLGIGLWMKNMPDKPKNPIVKISNNPKREKLAIKKVQEDTVGNTTLSAQRQANRTQSSQSRQAIAIQPANMPGNSISQNHGKQASVLPLKDSALNVTFIAKKLTDSSKKAISRIALTPKKSTDSLKTGVNKAPQLAVSNQPKNESQQSLVIKEKKPERSITTMLNEDKGTKVAKNEDEQPSKKVNFGVYAATYFNYSKGSSNQMNMGAGVTSDIRLNKNLKLVTGVAIAQNSLSYAGVPTVAASMKSSLFVPAASKDAMTFTALSTPTVKNYNASLIGLDIPINLKYEFSPQKTDAYVSMGLSSGTFIDESYTYKYNYPSLASPTLQQTKNETTGKNFNSFYFAKTLNVAFGVGYPFGKNRLIIEPFLKYPLDGMGSQNLRFGAGGLNLKFNFLSPRK